MLKKHFLLFLILFSLKSIDPLNAQNPSIGAILSPEDLFSDNEIYNGYRTLYLSIKNTGDEVLTNINVIDNNGYFSNYISCENNNIPFSCSDLSIETLNPNDVITLSFLIYNTSNCYENIQFEVTANSVSNGTINDFSDGYSYDYNNYTFVELNFNDISFQISDTYLDLNNNGLVDVGDAIEYDISSSIYTLGILYPNNQYTLNPTNLYNNETVTVSSTNNIIGDYVTATYYLNAADIAIGYAYYNPDIIYNFYDSCTYLNIYQSGNCFNCPIPNNCNNCIRTNLTDLLPNKISGQVTFDSNNDGCNTGLSYPNRRVQANTNGAVFSSFTNQQGEYSIYIPNINTYNTNAAVSLNPEFTSNPGSYSITSSGSNQTYDADFCISSTNNYTDLKVLIIPDANAVPGFNTSYIVKVYNQGSTALNGTVTLNYDPTLATLFEQLPTSNSNTTNSLTWNITNLLPFSYNDYFVGFTISVPPIVESDDIVSFTATTTQDITDDNPINNQYTLNQIAVNSFDPNDKTILEGPYITPEQADGYLHFLTRFQNEGTAPANKVVITETLSFYMDYATFEPVASSHEVDIQLIGDNQLFYTYENINLPHASLDEPGSHGWMLYKVKPKSWFGGNNVLTSQSNIYFDFNPAIITNEATTQIGTLSTNDFAKSNFKLYPNPVKDQLNIVTPNNLEYSITVTDINGKQLYISNFSNYIKIDTSLFQTGFYIVSIFNQKNVQNFKLIKK